ncbi:hypothetical protein [Arthrobacter sp. ISL-65]|uniref:hypothetical protein n=1 Tax=Arthrobacter sp. ISL-65 TaxID=2819112 RepID=UPI001BE86659|nr:hypothetical protein [Arthrobacter sp. ISL-65]MBT2551274.1 hypothetical protein [Arthrobacter sp. ISL-65]
MDPSLTVIVIAVAATVALVLGFVIAATLRPSKPGRHRGPYIPAKRRPVIRDATDRNASTEVVGPRSTRFPELELPLTRRRDRETSSPS